MKKRNRLFVGLTTGVVAIGALAATTQASDLYTIRTNDDMLRKFDTNTLTFTDIGTIGIAFDFGGMSWDSSTGTMYLVPGRAGVGLYKVDLDTGATTLVGNHGLTDLFSLAYDPTTNTMYAGQSSGARGFHKINLSNGATTLIGTPSINLDGLTYDPIRNKVVGGYAGPGDLYDMDLSTGMGTLIFNGDFFNNGGLTYDDESGLYWLIDWSGVMYTYDPANGYARTTVLTGLGSHDALSSAGPAGSCLDLVVSPLVSGQKARWDVDGATPSSTVAIIWGLRPGETVLNGFAGYCATFGIGGVNQSRVIGIAKADANGHVTVLKSQIPNSAQGLRILSQAAERDTCPNECVSNIDDQVVG